MPNYKTHSIHGEVIYPDIKKEIDIDLEDLKNFCIGPDTLIMSDYQLFHDQHAHRTKEYFLSLIQMIKQKKLQGNKKVMAFLYGQLDHFALDLTMHPFIYYMTEGLEKKHKVDPHGLVENWIDDYTMKKHKKEEKDYYHHKPLQDRELIKMIDELYQKIYKRKKESIKYELGLISVMLYERIARRREIKELVKLLNIGDITYHADYQKANPFLNLEKKVWLNPETGEEYHDSFDDLWEKSIDLSLETIEDINGYLYQDKELESSILENDISYNTGLPCSKGQSFQYIKKYRK